MQVKMEPEKSVEKEIVLHVLRMYSSQVQLSLWYNVTDRHLYLQFNI